MSSQSFAGPLLMELQRSVEWMTEQRDRRAVYRVTRRPSDAPELTLFVGDLRLPVILLDVSGQGAGVVVAGPDLPKLRAATVGARPSWSLVVAGSGLARPLRVPARPVAVQPWGGGARLALGFTLTPVQRSTLDDKLRAIFNQRRAVRVEADPEAPVPLVVSPARGGWRTAGLLRDASVSGVGLVVPAGPKVSPSVGDRLRITLRLSEDDPEAVIIGIVARATRVALPEEAGFEAVFQLGVDLDPEDADGARTSLALGRYVVRRQVAERRRRKCDE